MPVSASQHRVSSGVYQNKLYNNVKCNLTPVKNITANYSAISDEMHSFGNNINRTINSSHQRYLLPPQNANIVTPLLMLLSQIRFEEIYVPPALIANEGSFMAFSENTIHLKIGDNFFNTLLNPVVNVLHKTGEMISRYDPLKFPAVGAVSLSATTPQSVTTADIHFLSKNQIKKINTIMITVTNNKETEAIRGVINELNNIAIEAEKKFPVNRKGKKDINHLMYLIDKSKSIIDKFEIKHEQEALCKILRFRRKRYIDNAYTIYDDPSKIEFPSYLEFRQYIEASPPLTFTPDSRGSPFPSVESQIADNLVSRVFEFTDAQGKTPAQDSRHDAYKSLLTFLLAERRIGSIDFLPGGWNKANEDIRLVNILLRDLEANLHIMGSKYLLKPAKIFAQSYNETLSKDSTLPAEEVKKRLSSLHLNRNKLHLLRQSIRQPIEIKYNQQPDNPRFYKLLDLFITIQCITEAMHHDHLPIGSINDTDPHYRDISYGNQECKDVAKLKLAYNKNNRELTIYPSRGEIQDIKKNKLHIKEIINKNERIDTIKFTPAPSLNDAKHRPFIAAEIRPLITPEMYLNPRNLHGFSPPDKLGLVSDLSNEYLKINKKFVRIKHIPYRPHINNRYVIEDKINGNLYLRYREDKRFHPETHNERLDVDKIVDSVQIRPDAEPLTSDELHALRTYNRSARDGDEYRLSNIDDFMIKGMPENYQPSNLRASMVKTIDDIEHALKKTIPYKGVVYKDSFISKDRFNFLKKDQLLISKTFLSGSKSRPATVGFHQRYLDSHNLTDTHITTMYEFNTKESGHSLEWYTEKFYDDEVFIESNRYFKIRSVNYQQIIADEIYSSLLSHEEKSRAKNIDF